MCYAPFMTKLEKIEQEIASLAPADFHKLADWIAEHREELWDRQMETDLGSSFKYDAKCIDASFCFS